MLLLTLMYRLMQYITNPNARQQRKYLILDEAWALLITGERSGLPRRGCESFGALPVLRHVHDATGVGF